MGVWREPGMPLTPRSRETRQRSPLSAGRGHNDVRDMPDPLPDSISRCLSLS
jgi:hypothetical protein